MNNDYFHLIDTEEKVNWIIQEYGIDSLKLVLLNMIEEVTELAAHVKKATESIALINNAIYKIEESSSKKEIKEDIVRIHNDNEFKLYLVK